MKLETLLRRLQEGELTGDGSREVKSITHDSRKVLPGSIFAALPGTQVHGIEFLRTALQSGQNYELALQQVYGVRGFQDLEANFGQYVASLQTSPTRLANAVR